MNSAAKLMRAQSDNVSPEESPAHRRVIGLHLNWLEAALISTALIAILLTGLDAMDGQDIGHNDALTLAKHQAQPDWTVSFK